MAFTTPIYCCSIAFVKADCRSERSKASLSSFIFRRISSTAFMNFFSSAFSALSKYFLINSTISLLPYNCAYSYTFHKLSIIRYFSPPSKIAFTTPIYCFSIAFFKADCRSERSKALLPSFTFCSISFTALTFLASTAATSEALAGDFIPQLVPSTSSIAGREKSMRKLLNVRNIFAIS